ncbi:MAG: tripartite tricarboxylate transporter TctB family protein [Geminicoccaceae bacterium]
MRVNDAVFGTVLVLFALAMIGYTRTFPAMPGQDYGSALFPALIGIGFIVTGAILIAGGIARLRTEPLFGGGAWLRSRRHVVNFMAILVGLLAYIVVADTLGFVPTAFLILLGWLVLLRGGHLPSSLLIAIVVTLVVDYAFTQLLLVPLPLGLLEPILY